jgi:hypothetical protein
MAGSEGKEIMVVIVLYCTRSGLINCEVIEKSKIVLYVKEREKQSGEAIYDYIHMSLLPRIMRYACIYCINKEIRFEQKPTL